MPRYSKAPVSLITPTMIIIPSSRKMTFQSMPACSEKKISSPGVSRNRAIRPAAVRTTATRFTFSVAIRMNATMKMDSAAIAVTVGHPVARRRAAGPRSAHSHVVNYLDALEELLHGGRTRVRGPAAESGVDRSGESALDTGRVGPRRGQAEPGQPRAGRGTSDPGGARQ